MFYKSTRDSSLRVTSAEAISKGISDDGGLFVPENIPEITMDELKAMEELKYSERAARVFAKYLTDFSDAEIHYCTDNAYTTKNFDTENISELVPLFENSYTLELWHGPTCAFKDMALQILPYFLTTSVKKLNINKKVVILVATSGDTGKAALEGFKDVPGTEIMVFYPEDGVSAMQKRQMVTTGGSNVEVAAVEGNFDDCQSEVKKIFTDEKMKERLDKNGLSFSSANSINWGRLVPQIVYYISAYVSLAKKGDIKYGDKINIVVPTGNFGNILAAYYAKHMGVPVNKLICASNINNVLTDFIQTGIYDRNRHFYTTTSPSMDILISSNLERLLYLITEDDKLIREWFGKLKESGKYEVNDEVKNVLKNEFWAGFASDDETRDTIAKTFKEKKYLCDTHTGVAVKVYLDYVKETGDNTKTIIASTASPYKFCPAVLAAIDPNGKEISDDFERLERVHEISGLAIPKALGELKNAKPRFDKTVSRAEMEDYVASVLGV